MSQNVFNLFWFVQNADGGIKSLNNSRITLDPEGNLWFSNVTRDDASDDFHYACSATSIFRYEMNNQMRVLSPSSVRLLNNIFVCPCLATTR